MIFLKEENLISTIVTIAVLALDQLSKFLTKEFVRPAGSIPILEEVFHLTYAENRGAAFGLLQGFRWFFVVLTILISICIIYYMFKLPSKQVFFKISLSLILGGALGNLFDRIRLGYVVDMFDFTLINFPIFNVADSSLVIGTFFISYFLLFVKDLDFLKL